jgi:WD40 repeat protein
VGVPSVILRQLHRIRAASCQQVIQTPSPARAIAYAADGTEILAGHEDGVPRLWDAKSFELARNLAKHEGPIVSVSGRGARWATGSSDGTARIFGASGDAMHVLRGERPEDEAPCTSVAWNTEATRLLSGWEDHSARLHDGERGLLLKRMRMPASPELRIGGVAFGPEEVQIALLRGGGALLWEGDRETQSAVFELATPGDVDEAGVCLSFSRDRRIIAAAVRGCDIQLCHWDEPVCTLRGHTDAVTSLAWSPEGRFLLSGSEDCTAKIWDTTTRECVCTIADHVGAVFGVAFHPHGHDCATSSEDGTLRIYELESEWFELRDAIDQASVLLQGRSTKLWPTTAPFDMDLCLDVWSDLRRRARHQKITPELAQRGDRVRTTILELLQLLCGDATPEVPLSGIERYKHPLLRVALADVRMAIDLCARLGGDAQQQAQLHRLRRVPTVEIGAANATLAPPPPLRR